MPGDKSSHQQGSASVLRLRLLGSDPAAQVTGEDELPGKSNYFIGNDPKQWRTNVQHYGKVRYHDVYPGVDLVYYGNQGQLEHDFVIAPGADFQRIHFSATGAETPSLTAHDDLQLHLGDAGDLTLHHPVAYQEIAGLRKEVAAHYVTNGNDVGFELGPYDKNQPVVIDPVLTFSTFVGGSGADGCCGVIAVDSVGSVYFSGTTRSFDYPTTPGSVQPTFGGSPAICNQPNYNSCGDIVVTKLNSSGTALIYSTYLGGTGSDSNFGMALDGAGSVYVAGETESTDFPITPGALQPQYNGGNCSGYAGCGDVTVSKLDPTGSKLVYSTYLGGSDNESPQNITVDAAGEALVAGWTFSSDFPTTPGVFQPHLAGPENAFLSKLNATGTALVYSSFLGGSAYDGAYGIQVDAAGRAYVSGVTSSTDFPITDSAYQTHLAGEDDIFVSLINPSGTKLLYSTYLGGSANDITYASALDSSGNLYIPGFTTSPDFPVTPGAYQTTFAGVTDAFVFKLNPFRSGRASLVYSTLLGTSSDDEAYALGVDKAGNAYISGITSSPEFPIVNPIQALNKAHSTGFVAELNPTGSSLIFSTYIGGSNSDSGDIAVDSSGNIFLTGAATSTDFPVTPRAFQPKFAGGNSDIYVAKISMTNSPGVSFLPTALTFAGQAVGTISPSQTVVLSNVGSAPLKVSRIQTSGNFSQTNNCDVDILGGGSCAVSIAFSPTALGSRSGTLVVTDNASFSPQKMVLTGTGK
jgi:hypothetical protein